MAIIPIFGKNWGNKRQMERDVGTVLDPSEINKNCMGQAFSSPINEEETCGSENRRNDNFYLFDLFGSEQPLP